MFADLSATVVKQRALRSNMKLFELKIF